eukprot:TRINITY_DN8711_c0_g1_i1.p1 TRINITY_DN8711_c0_g1~~TRINITY_DN8711_c0_g1_i1.p1  ORF type:complete len:282 (+),score=47.38 TRINITY_DN8711_c0_g1_i1:91-936(+)
MATTGFDTTHGDIIHDVQMDYYGRRIATCSSDRTICIFEVSTEAPVRTAQLMGHSGPVWQVSWAHPRFGNILASCSYDRRIIVWKEAQQNQWIQIYTYDQHNSSVNSVAWAPHEYGLVLAAGSADGTISIHSYKEHDPWTVFTQDAHHGGTNSVSWAPSTYTKSEETQYLASAGCDGSTTIWRRADKKWIPVKQLSQSKSWLRGISWAPNLGLPGFVIATCSQVIKSLIIEYHQVKNMIERGIEIRILRPFLWTCFFLVSSNFFMFDVPEVSLKSVVCDVS